MFGVKGGVWPINNIPGRVHTSRPARPILCLAELFDMGCTSKLSTPIFALNPRTFATPQSITYRMPEMVIDVSAMLVASTTLRVLCGAGSKTFCCCAGGSAANKGHGSNACTFEGSCPAYSVNRAVRVSISS